MENASKALIMAGSILIALMVIGLATLTYHQISKVEQEKNDTERLKKIVDYEKEFMQYNRTIYGSELLSLGNLQSDYNLRQAEQKGYYRVTITIEIKQDITENKKSYLPIGQQAISSIRTSLYKLEEDIIYYETDNNGHKNKKERNKRSVKYYAQLSNRQIATLFEIPFTSKEPDYEIGNKLETNFETQKLMEDIQKYKNLKTAYTAFKNTVFTCKDIKYDANGRMTSMHFVEG